MNDYEQKQADRRERLERASERATRESSAAFNNAHAQIDGIPPGQPILVGHHSERRHRAALARHDRAMRRGLDADKAARELARRADAVGTGGISQDDPDAIAKLRTELEALQANQAKMRSFNAAWRKNGAQGLMALGMSAEGAAKIARQIELAYSWEKSPYAKYQLSNNSANIRRIEQRIAMLDAKANTPERDMVIGAGWKLYESAELNRTCLEFEARVPETVYKALKSYGFRKTREGIWQRHRSAQAWHTASSIGDLMTAQHAIND